MSYEPLNKYKYVHAIPKIVVHCTTEKEMREFFNIVEIEFSDIVTKDILDDYKKDSRFYFYGEHTIYCIHEDGTIGYGSVKYCEKYPFDYKIVPFGEFLLDTAPTLIDEQLFEELLLGE